MGYQLSKTQANDLFRQWAGTYDIFAPRLMEGEGCFSDTDIVRYGKVSSLDDIEWSKKSDYSFKEVLLAINETLFYFTEDQTMVPKGPQKDILIFLRSCDLHAVKRLDEIYLKNRFEDFYYARVRERAKFILMGCETTCASGFCVSMGTNKSENYDAYIKVNQDTVYMDLKWNVLEEAVKEKAEVAEVTPDYVTENKEKVTLPKNLSNESFTKDSYKKIIHQSGKIVGAILQGDLAYAGILQQLIARKIDITKVKKPIFDVDYSDFFHVKDNFEFYYED